MKRHIIFLILLFYTFYLQGQTLHQDILTTYNFEPHKISGDEQKKKIILIDAFWNKVTKDKDKYLDELRKELKDTSNPSYFSYDGGHLLLSLSQTNEDYQIALNAMLRANLKDIDCADYVKTMNLFACKGLNTTEAGLNIISDEKFSGFITEHYFKLEKYSSLIFVLLPIDNKLYITQVIDRLAQVKDSLTIINVLQFLDYTCSCKADSMILKYSTDKNQCDTVRKAALLIVKNNSVIKRSDNPEIYKELAEKRKDILNTVHNKALFKLDEDVCAMKKNYNCQ